MLEHLPFAEQPRGARGTVPGPAAWRRALVSVPNLAHLQSRVQFLLRGRLIRTASELKHPGDRPAEEYIASGERAGFSADRRARASFRPCPVVTRMIRRHPRALAPLHRCADSAAAGAGLVLPQSPDVPQALIGSVLQLIERRTVYVIVAIGLLFTLAYMTNLVLFPKPDGRVLIGDAVHPLRAAAIGGDRSRSPVRNDYIRMYRCRAARRTPIGCTRDTATGHVRNYMPVGPAILWAPLFLLGWVGASLANLVGAGWPVDGYSAVLPGDGRLSGVLRRDGRCRALMAARLQSLRRARRRVGPRSSCGSPRAPFTTRWYHRPIRMPPRCSPPVRSGTCSSAREKSNDLRRYAMLGTLAGFAALMRWQDAILLASIAFDLGWRLRARAIRLPERADHSLFVAAGAALLVFVPQMIVWMSLYGRPLAMPQGPGFMLWTQPALLAVLVSDWHGLFTWTPVVAIALIGFIPLCGGSGRTVIAAAAIFLMLSWYVNAAVADWWAGEAFGSRRFISCIPVFVLSLAALIDAWSPSARQVALAIAAVIGYTFLLLVQYQAFMHGLRQVAPYPLGGYNLVAGAFVGRIDVVRESRSENLKGAAR